MAKKNKAFRFRIYPNRQQEQLFAKTFGCCRFIYNRMLADKKERYELDQTMLRTSPAAYKKECPWLKEVDSLALCNAQIHLEQAYKNFFSRPEAGYPKFKSKHHSAAAYTTNLVNGNIRIENGRLRLPKAGYVRIICHRPIPPEWRMKSVTISREPSGKYYASVLCECDAVEKQDRIAAPEEMKILGIDFTMNGLAVFSDGSSADYPAYYSKAQGRLAREQKRLSHCEKGSRNYGKQKKRVARCHEKVRNQRKDFHHKLSRKIADAYDVVGVENLDMKEMSQTMNFGKKVMDNGYGMFLTILGYKLEEQGKQLIKMDKYFPSSKRCSVCGSIKADLTLADRVYVCRCGNVMDRDVNAAINIRDEAYRQITA